MAATESLDALGIDPSFGSSNNSKVTTLRSDFGSGYSQRGRANLNAAKQTWSLNFDNLTTVQHTSLRALLDTLGSDIGVLWTPPRQSVQLQWTVIEGSVTETPKTGGTVSDISFQLQQEFDL